MLTCGLVCAWIPCAIHASAYPITSEIIMNETEFLDEINTLNGKPIETFKKFGLPITVIEDVELVKSGKFRKFIYQGREVFSPEIVSVLHFEKQGLKACWSEGIAVQLINMAVGRYVFKGYESLVRYVGIKPQKLKEAEIELEKRLQQERDAPAWATAAEESVRSNPLSKIRKVEPQVLTVMNITGLDRSEELEKFMLGEGAGIFPYSFSDDGKAEWLEKSLNRFVSIQVDASVQEIREIVLERLDQIKRDSQVLKEFLILPDIAGKKQYDFHAKFYKPYALDFAFQLLNHIPSGELLSFISDFGVKNWDLMVLAPEPGKIRLVEVKLDDDLTMNQRRMLAEALAKGEVIELCVVQPKRA